MLAESADLDLETNSVKHRFDLLKFRALQRVQPDDQYRR